MNNQRCSKYQLITPFTDSLGTIAEEDTSIRGVDQKELIESSNTLIRLNTLKKSIRDSGNKNINLVVVPIVINIDTPNIRKESQEIKINLFFTYLPISVKVL